MRGLGFRQGNSGDSIQRVSAQAVLLSLAERTTGLLSSCALSSASQASSDPLPTLSSPGFTESACPA